MNRFIEAAADRLLGHFRGQAETLQMFIEREYTSEEWFRIEILSALRGSDNISTGATNKADDEGARPDLVVVVGDDTLTVELKVLPTDRNYSTAYQRFTAGKNNKNDFRRLRQGDRDGVIYVYWPSQDIWDQCKHSLLRDYPGVECLRSDQVDFPNGTVFITYWGRAHQLSGVRGPPP